MEPIGHDTGRQHQAAYGLQYRLEVVLLRPPPKHQIEGRIDVLRALSVVEVKLILCAVQPEPHGPQIAGGAMYTLRE